MAVKRTSKKQSHLIDDYHLLTYASLDSTNDEARRIAEGGGSHGAFIWALEQTHGKGRNGREWVSQEGNLYISVLLSPDCQPAELPQLSFVTALAAVDSIKPLLSEPERVTCKWPNDVLIGDKKAGGILLESFETQNEENTKRWAVCGLGLNIESCPEEAMYPATYLKNEGVELVSAKIVLSRFIHHFIERYQIWRHKGFTEIHKDWVKSCAGIGKPIKVRLPNEELNGVFESLDKQGNLVLKLTNGEKRPISAGDVFLT